MQVEKLSCERAMQIVADSPAGSRTLFSTLNLSANKSQLIWQAIDADQRPANENDRISLRRQLGWPIDTIVAIFTGTLYRLKGIDILFDAMRMQPDDKLRLVVLGSGVLETALRETCRSDATLGHRIYLGGFQRNVYTFLRGADLFVLPSRQEGTSTSLLEALSVGICAVGSDVGGIHDVLSVGKCGLLVPPENPEALAEAMRFLVETPEQRIALGCRGREFVIKHCRADDMARQYIKVFQQMAMASFPA